MPDIDPAALSRPAIGLSTPILSTKTLANSGITSAKFTKSSQIIPSRIDLEPIYGALREAIGPEQWIAYKEATREYLIGRLNQVEFSEQVGPILSANNGEKEHLHNALIGAIYGNVTREMPDQGPAPWVSANDKPVPTSASKPVTGDATEQRLKGDVMQLPARDRRRIKDLTHNEYDPSEHISHIFLDVHRRPSAIPEVPPSATPGINKMNFDLEIRKRFTQPLALESGEFPDTNQISARMLPFCYEVGLPNGHAADGPHLMSVATENFVKELLTQLFSRTKCNGPGESGSAGFGVGTGWIQTHRYKRQLGREEDAVLRGDINRDKSGLLPVESKAASERGPLCIADVRVALEMADPGILQYPIVATQILHGYRDGELTHLTDYSWVDGKAPPRNIGELSTVTIASADARELLNGYADPMDIDSEPWWDGTEDQELDFLDGVLDSCMTVG